MAQVAPAANVEKPLVDHLASSDVPMAGELPEPSAAVAPPGNAGKPLVDNPVSSDVPRAEELPEPSAEVTKDAQGEAQEQAEPDTLRQAALLALKQQPRSLGVTLAHCVVATIIFSPYALGWTLFNEDQSLHPLWCGLLMALMLLGAIAAFGFGEHDRGVRWAYLHADLAAAVLAVPTFIVVSATFDTPLWRTAPVEHIAWTIPSTIILMCWCAIPLSRVTRAAREDLANKGRTVTQSLIVLFLMGACLGLSLFVVVGAMFAMRFYSGRNEPIAETLVVSVGYPCVRFGLKTCLGWMVAKQGLAHEGDDERHIIHTKRITLAAEVYFALPSMSAMVLMDWPGYLVAHATNIVLEAASDWLILEEVVKEDKAKATLGKAKAALIKKLQKGQVAPIGDEAVDEEQENRQDDAGGGSTAAEAPCGPTSVARRLKIQVARLAAEDCGEKVIAVTSAPVAWLAAELITHHAALTLGVDAAGLVLALPSGPTVAFRGLLNLIFEVATDVCKNVLLWRSFKVLPARESPLLSVVDTAQVATMLVCSAGTILAGMALASAQ